MSDQATHCFNCETGWAEGPLCRLHANEKIGELNSELDEAGAFAIRMQIILLENERSELLNEIEGLESQLYFAQATPCD